MYVYKQQNSIITNTGIYDYHELLYMSRQVSYLTLWIIDVYNEHSYNKFTAITEEFSNPC